MSIWKALSGLATVVVAIVFFNLMGWPGILVAVAPELIGLAKAHWALWQAKRLQAKVEEELRFRAAKPVWRELPWNG